MAAIAGTWRGVRMAAGAALAVLLGACSGGPWPVLSDVARPPGSGDPADVGEGAAAPAPPAAEAPVPAEVAARLQTLEAAFATRAKAVAAAYADYETRLDRLLTSPGDETSLGGHWTAAQSSLSRVGTAIDHLRADRDALAAYALDLAKGGAVALQGVAERVRAVDDDYDAWRRTRDLETNRLATLTPASFGAPGPAAVGDTGRTALATIRFADERPAFAATLDRTVRAVRASVPDVAFDVIASGPDGSLARQQAALRAVMAALRRGGLDAGKVALALAAAPADPAVTVRVYLRKTSP